MSYIDCETRYEPIYTGEDNSPLAADFVIGRTSIAYYNKHP